MGLKHLRTGAGLVLAWLIAGAHGQEPMPGTQAAEAPPVPVVDLLSLDLTRLLELRVNLSSRLEERAFTAAAAVYVLERDDILRSGYRRLGDVMRLLPGAQVGQADAGKRGVSVRNGLSRFSSTLLVMVDGRHVYTPLFGGVRWEVQDLPLDDIERIEFVRGAGGPLWGANAVDGILHITTRSAAASAGSRAELGAGRGDLTGQLHLRHGEASENFAWRLSAQRYQTDTGRYLPADISSARALREAGAEANDGGGGSGLQLRADWRNDRDQFSLLAGVTRHAYDEDRVLVLGVLPNALKEGNAFATLDWQHRLGDRESLRLRTTADRTSFDDAVLRDRQSMVDMDLQYTLTREEHRIAAGLGYRHFRSNVRPPSSSCGLCFGYLPQVDSNQTLSAFVQGQWLVQPGLVATLGTKFESSQWAGAQWQPTTRLAWQPSADQALWVAWTRPVRTPTRTERGRGFLALPANLAVPFGCRTYVDQQCLQGNPDSPTWDVRSLEAGWRLQASPALSLDLALFDNRYDYGSQPARADTPLQAQIHGAELVVRWQPQSTLQVESSWSWHSGTNRYADDSTRPVPLLAARMWKLRTRWNIDPRWTLDGNLERSSELPRDGLPPPQALPAGTRANIVAGWRPAAATQVQLALTNILGDGQGEYIEGTSVNTAARRGVFVSVSQSF